MHARSSREVYRRLYGQAKEQLTGISGRNLDPKCRFSGSFAGSSTTLPGSKERTVINASRGISGRNPREAEVVMVRRVEMLGSLRGMGVTHRPADSSAQHGVRSPVNQSDDSPMKSEERHTDEVLQQAKPKKAEKIKEAEQSVGVAGESLAAVDSEFVDSPGSKSEDIQKESGEEFIRRSEPPTEDSEEGHPDPNGETKPEVDEEVKRGLVADSEMPMGRVEKKAEEPKPFNADVSSSTDEALDTAQNSHEKAKGGYDPEEHANSKPADIEEHGSFKAL